MAKQLLEDPALIQILLGPRQCGKSTLFASFYVGSGHGYGSGGYGIVGAYGGKVFQEITFDDLQLRKLANQDPALFLQQFDPPLLLDEVQYVPNLFPELKKRIDEIKRQRVFDTKQKKAPKVLYRLTGSNQILMDKNVKESLAGRASYYHLNTLTVHEILNAFPETKISMILFKGGWPELYTNTSLSTINYLNDYILTYVEKDIGRNAGVEKLAEFNTILGILAARTAQLTNFSDIAKDSGVSAVTVKEWTNILEHANLVYKLKPYHKNLNKRLIKTPKLYFLDTGLAVRLQGWSDPTPLINSPQIGALFESLVLAEIVKFIQNYRKDWQLFFWRTKDGEEIDFIIKTANDIAHAFEVKFAIHGVSQAIAYPAAFKKEFSVSSPLVVITGGGRKVKLSSQCITLPIAELHDYLLTI